MHTNSTTVLRYIVNEQQRFHVFAANPVQLIRDCSDPDQWRCVETKENPADDASRGTNGVMFLKQRRRFEGPDMNGHSSQSTWVRLPMMIQKLRSASKVMQRRSVSWITLPASWLVSIGIGWNEQWLYSFAQRKYYRPGDKLVLNRMAKHSVKM